MATLEKNIFGNMSGKIGRTYARIKNGRTIISALPMSYHLPMDEESVKRRETFICGMRFSKQIYKLPVIKKIWSDFNNHKDMTTYNKIVSANAKLASPEKPTADNIMTPKGFLLAVKNIEAACDNLTAVLPALNLNEKFTRKEVNLSINAAICFHTPHLEVDEFYKVIHLNLEVQNYNFGEEYNFRIDFNPSQKGTAAKYKNGIIYMAVVTKRADEKIVKYSKTFSKTFDLFSDQSKINEEAADGNS